MEGEALDFGLVAARLTDAGVPEKYLFFADHRELVGRWLADGLTCSQLAAAIEYAQQHKRPGAPLSPRYIDRVITSQRTEAHATSGAGGARRLRGHEIGDAIGDEWLAEGRAARAASAAGGRES